MEVLFTRPRRRQKDRDARVTVLVSSHDLNHVTDVCQRIFLMERGRIVKDIGTTADTLQELKEYFQV